MYVIQNLLYIIDVCDTRSTLYHRCMWYKIYFWDVSLDCRKTSKDLFVNKNKTPLGNTSKWYFKLLFHIAEKCSIQYINNYISRKKYPQKTEQWLYIQTVMIDEWNVESKLWRDVTQSVKFQLLWMSTLFVQIMKPNSISIFCPMEM